VTAQRPTRPPLLSSGTVTLRVNGNMVDTAPVPGSVSYALPAAGGYTASWSVVSSSGPAELTWHVSCALPVGSPPPAPTSKKQCKHGGWRNLGTMFKNQGDCVSFVTTGGKNPPSGP
jgi:hypothetical protein